MNWPLSEAIDAYRLASSRWETRTRAAPPLRHFVGRMRKSKAANGALVLWPKELFGYGPRSHMGVNRHIRCRHEETSPPQTRDSTSGPRESPSRPSVAPSRASVASCASRVHQRHVHRPLDGPHQRHVHRSMAPRDGRLVRVCSLTRNVREHTSRVLLARDSRHTGPRGGCESVVEYR